MTHWSGCSNAPRLRWHAGAEAWGTQTFKVLIDGNEVGTTTDTSIVLTTALSDGAHRWQVIATDARGQETPMKQRTLRIDTTAPDVKVRISGSRRAPAKSANRAG